MLTDWVTGGGNLIAMRPDKQLAGLLGLTDAGATLAERLPAGRHRARARAPASSARRCSSTAPPTATRSTARPSVADALLDAPTAATTSPAVTLRSVGSQRRPGGGVHLRPRALGRLHAPGQPGVGRPGARRHRARSAPTTCSSARRRRLAARLGRPEQGRDPAGRRAAAPARQPDRHDEPRPEAAAALLVPPARREGGRRHDRRRPRQRRHRRALRPVHGRAARRAARSPTGSASAAPPTSIPNTPLTNAAGGGLRRPGLRGRRCTSTPTAPTSRRRRSTTTSTTSSRDFAATLPERAGADDQPHPLHRLERLGDARRRSSSRHGIRLDTNYYYWPPAAGSHDRPGMFTGSGMPMRFADLDGSMIDVYQATTQMTDESGQSTRSPSTRCSTARSAPRATTASSPPTCTPTASSSPGVGRDRRLGAGARRAGRLRAADADLARRPQRLVVRRDRLERRHAQLHASRVGAGANGLRGDGPDASSRQAR